jgi:hypothetical protein
MNMNRKDAKLTTRGKRATVNCWKASRIGYSKHNASPGDLLTFDTGDGREHFARVVGRVDALAVHCSTWSDDHDRKTCQYCTPEVKGWICVVMLSSSTMHHAYEMWVDPEWVTNVEALTPGHVRFWQTMLTTDPQDLMSMSEYGSLSAYGTCDLPPAPSRAADKLDEPERLT